MSKTKRVLHSSWTRYRAATAKSDGFPSPPGPGRGRAGRPAVQLDWPCHAAGSAGGVTIQVADDLGAQGDQLAAMMLPQLADVVGRLNDLWEGVTLPSCNLVLAPLSPAHDGSGGAYHYDCSGTDLYCDAAYDSTGQMTLALFLAEASEVLQARQARGWDCGASNGEGLSRFHAEVLLPGVLDSYHTFDAWLDGDRPDWVSRTDATDGNPISTGCAVGFLFWLRSQGYTEQDITVAAGPTLADTYKALDGEGGNAYQAFKMACDEKWPNKPSGVNTDDPWEDEPEPPEPPEPPQPTTQTITISSDLPAGTYTITPAGQSGGGQGPGQSVLAEVQAIMQGGATTDQVGALLQALGSALQKANGGVKPPALE